MYYSFHEDNERNRLVEAWKKIEQPSNKKFIPERKAFNINKKKSKGMIKESADIKIYENIFREIFTQFKNGEPVITEKEIREDLVRRNKAFYEGFFSDLVSAAKGGLKAAGEDWKNSKEKKIAANAMKEIEKIFADEKAKLDKALPALSKIYQDRIAALEKVKAALEKHGDEGGLGATVDQYINDTKQLIDNLSGQHTTDKSVDNIDQVVDKIEKGEMPDEKDAEEVSSPIQKTGATDSSEEEPKSQAEKVTQAAEVFKQDQKQFEKSFFTWIKDNKDNLKDIISSGSEGGDVDGLLNTLKNTEGASNLSDDANKVIAQAAIDGKDAEGIRQELKNLDSSFSISDDVRHAIGKALGEVGREEDTSKLQEKRNFKTYFFEGVAEDLVKHYSSKESFISGIEKSTGVKPSQEQIANLITKFVDSEDFKGQFGADAEGLDMGGISQELNQIEGDLEQAATSGDIGQKVDVLTDPDVFDLSKAAQETPEGRETIQAAFQAAQKNVDPEEITKAALNLMQNNDEEQLKQQFKELEQSDALPKSIWGKMKEWGGKAAEVAKKAGKSQQAKTIGWIAAGALASSMGIGLLLPITKAGLMIHKAAGEKGSYKAALTDPKTMFKAIANPATIGALAGPIIGRTVGALTSGAGAATPSEDEPTDDIDDESGDEDSDTESGDEGSDTESTPDYMNREYNYSQRDTLENFRELEQEGEFPYDMREMQRGLYALQQPDSNDVGSALRDSGANLSHHELSSIGMRTNMLAPAVQAGDLTPQQAEEEFLNLMQNVIERRGGDFEKFFDTYQRNGASSQISNTFSALSEFSGE